MKNYHMHLKEREITDSALKNEIFLNGKFTTISLVRNNEPYIVTMSYGYDEGEKKLYFHTANKGLKLEFIE